VVEKGAFEYPQQGFPSVFNSSYKPTSLTRCLATIYERDQQTTS